MFDTRVLSKPLALALLLFGVLMAHESSEQSTLVVHLKIGVQQTTGLAPFFIAYEKGYYKQEGLDVELSVIDTGTAVIPLLSTGQLDVASGSASPALWNAVARGFPLKIIAALGSVGPAKTGFSSVTWLVVSKQSAETGRIKTYSDLKGKTIAISGLGLSNDILVDRALHMGGLTRRDADVKALGLADMLPALANGAIDVAAEIEPLVAKGVSDGLIVPWKNAVAIYPGQVASVVLSGPGLVDKGPDVGKRFTIAFTKGVRDYNDAFGPKHLNTDQIVSILTKYTTVKDPSLYGKMTWNFINPDCRADASSMRTDLKWYVTNGYVAKEPNIDAVVENKYCDAAVATLGKYR